MRYLLALLLVSSIALAEPAIGLPGPDPQAVARARAMRTTTASAGLGLLAAGVPLLVVGERRLR
jgi:hypothetical protein